MALGAIDPAKHVSPGEQGASPKESAPESLIGVPRSLFWIEERCQG